MMPRTTGGKGFILQPGDVRLIRGFFPVDKCRSVIEMLANNAMPIDANHPDFETPHVFQIFRFEKPLFNNIQEIFGPMFDKWKELSNNDIKWEDKRVRPQIIHYPKGGGFFGRHSHPRHPQEYGLVLNLTDGPGTMFHFDDGDYQVQAKAGDLTIFRYDIPHSVPMIDPGSPLEFHRPTGRWTAILPVYE